MRDETDLSRLAASTSFRPEALDKIIKLFELLVGFRSHPFLKSRIALKGGTAVNLFVFDVPRLSVDIDLNYIGAVDRTSMLAERPQLQRAVEAVCSRADVAIRHAPEEHAGGKWRLSYRTATGRSGTLELDLNFLFRTPLWPTATIDSRRVGIYGAEGVPVLDIHELTAGKLAALFGRSASRDLFDVRELLANAPLDVEMLRLAFVVYGGTQRRDWRTVTTDEIRADPEELHRRLIPLLRSDIAPEQPELTSWADQLVDETRDRLTALLPLRTEEMEFLDRINDRGEIVPELLTGEDALQHTIRSHPGLRWKALNVREHHGLGGTRDDV